MDDNEIDGGSLVGRWTYCHALRSDDLPPLYALLIEPGTGWQLRYRGSTPSFREFEAHAWDDVLAQWVVRSRKTNLRVGTVLITTANLCDGYASISIFSWPQFRGSGLIFDGVGICLDYVFACWPLRKIYAEVAATNFPAFSSVLRKYATHEGTRRRHLYVAGDYQDVHLLAIDRDRWIAARQ